MNCSVFRVLFLSFLVIGLVIPVWAQEQGACRSYVLAEASSGEVISSQGVDQPLPPASMAKLMTAYLIYKKIEDGLLQPSEAVTVTAEASHIGGSQVYLKENETFSVSELLSALLIQSANDAALALALHSSGTRDAFVNQMNEEAKKIGMLHANFHSPHGLPPSKDQEPDLVSASDMVTLARTLITEFPQILEITNQQVAPFRSGSFEMRNHNGLLRSFQGTDGLKTGFYDAAGFCVTATAVRNGVRLIAVLMGCPSRKERDQEAARLFAEGFAQYRSQTMVKSGELIGSNASVARGVKLEVGLTAKDSVTISVRPGKESEIQRRVQPCQNLEAPVAQGATCGQVEFFKGSVPVGRSDLLVAETVERAGLLKRALQLVGL